jgi:hypothetical protein
MISFVNFKSLEIKKGQGQPCPWFGFKKREEKFLFCLCFATAKEAQLPFWET